MYLFFHDLDVKKHLTGAPSARYNKDGSPISVSFTMDEPLHEEGTELPTLTGAFDLMSDDEMLLRDFTVDQFLRYEDSFNTEAGTETLFFTTEEEPVVPPTPAPTPEQYAEQLKSQRTMEAQQGMADAIARGIYVTTAYGDEWFQLGSDNMAELLGIQGIVASGATYFPYHAIDKSTGEQTGCKVYDAADLAKISAIATDHVTYVETYTNMFVRWVNDLGHTAEDIETLEGMRFGVLTALPEEYASYLTMIMNAALQGTDPQSQYDFRPEVNCAYFADMINRDDGSDDEESTAE